MTFHHNESQYYLDGVDKMCTALQIKKLKAEINLETCEDTIQTYINRV